MTGVSGAVPREGGPLRLAHRGDWRRAPENSLAALRAALDLPRCDGLEFDVRVSADGVPVLNHDETLARVHGRSERVDDLPASVLEAIAVPRLATVLAEVRRDAFLDIELKGRHGAATVEVIEAGRGPALEAAVVSSFEPESLEVVARLRPRWPRWLNAEDLEPAALGLATDLGCRGISVDWRAVDGPSIGRASAAALEVAAWTVRRRPTFARLERLGVVAVCVEGAALDG